MKFFMMASVMNFMKMECVGWNLAYGSLLQVVGRESVIVMRAGSGVLTITVTNYSPKVIVKETKYYIRKCRTFFFLESLEPSRWDGGGIMLNA